MSRKKRAKIKKNEENAQLLQKYNTFLGFCGLTLEIRPCVLTLSVSIKSH